MLVGANVITVLCLVSVGAIYGYAKYRLGQIRTIGGLHLSREPGGGLTVMNILLVGDNSRVGLSPTEAAKFGTTAEAGGAHSDVTMVLHLDPVAGTASLLSIPRDLFVPLPPKSIAGRVGKIDAALNGTNYKFSDGANNLIETIQNDLGIPINHYVQLNFDGFQRTVDALGGINMSFSTPLFDAFSGLRITQVGCDHLSGSAALAVVRARHLQYLTPAANPGNPRAWPQESQSDLARIQRDQTFLRVFAGAAKSQGLTTDLFKLNNVLGALTNQIAIDPGLKGKLVPLVKRFRHLDENTIPEMTLPVTVSSETNYRYAGGTYGTVDFPVEPADHQMIARWQGRRPPKPDPGGITVVVHNTSGVARRAATTAAALAALGYNTADAGQSPVPATTVETLLRYPAGGIGQAETVLQALTGPVMMQLDPTVPAGTVDLDAGTALSVVSAPGAPATVPTSVAGRAAAATSTTIAAATSVTTPWNPVACPPGQPVHSG